MTVPRGESTATMRVKTGPGALPYVGQAYALVEEVTRRARVAGTDRYTATMLPLGTDELWEVTATPQGRDSMTVVLGPLGRFRARVDGQGTRSEEHTSELQSRLHLVCRLLLEKKKKKKGMTRI